MSDTTPDLHTMTGAYVVDALDDVERQRFEAHLQVCAACRQEVAELAATAERLAVAATDQPPPGLRDRVLTEAARTRQLSPLAPDPVLPGPASTRWYRQPMAWAAALLLVVAGGLGIAAVTQAQRADRAEEQAAQIAEVATDPDRVVTTGEAATGGAGTVVAAGDTAVFRTAGLPELPPGQDYQLWVITGSDADSAGVLGRDGRLQAVVDGVEGADALGLTVEPAGGSAQPTGQLVLRLDLA